jgi:Ca2+:H+ antiporter
MIGFYVIIALWTWFYPGQPEQKLLLVCGTTIAEAVTHFGQGGTEGAEGAVSHLVTGLF